MDEKRKEEEVLELTAASPCSYHRKIISHSDGHSVVKYKRLKNTPSRSSQRKGVKYSIFAKFSRKNFYPSISRQREGQKYYLFAKFLL